MPRGQPDIIDLTANSSNEERRRFRARRQAAPAPAPSSSDSNNNTNRFTNAITFERHPRSEGVQLDRQWYEPEGLWLWVSARGTVPHSRRGLTAEEREMVRQAAREARQRRRVRNAAVAATAVRPVYLRRPTRYGGGGHLVFKVTDSSTAYVLQGGRWRLRRASPSLLHAVLTDIPVAVEVSAETRAGPWRRMAGPTDTWSRGSPPAQFFQALRASLPIRYAHVWQPHA